MKRIVFYFYLMFKILFPSFLPHLWDRQKLDVFPVTCHLVLDLGTKDMRLPRQGEIQCILPGYHIIIWFNNGRELNQS